MTDTSTSTSYDLFADAPASSSLEIPAGTSLLVTAPLPAGREVVLRSIESGLQAGDAGLVMTTDESSTTIVTDLRERIDEDRTGGPSDGHKEDAVTDRLRIIDCQTDAISDIEDPVIVQNVNTPRNLTDIGIGFKNAFDEFETAGQDRVRFGLLSLSVILSYADRETVYRFCQTLTRGLAKEQALGLFHLTPEAHDDRTVNTLRRAFDGTIEVNTTDDGIEAQVTGLDTVPDGWTQVG